MKKWIFFFLFSTINFLSPFGCKYDKLDDCVPSDIKFSTAVNPIIQSSCAGPGCHDGTVYTGDYRTYAGLKANVDNGTFKARVIDVHAMPPVNKLSECQYKILKAWYD